MNSIEQLKKSVPLIAPKHFSEFKTPEEYHEYVSGMYELRQKGSKPTKPKGLVNGITLKRTKKGAISILRNVKQRPFAYILQEEIALLVDAGIGTTAEIWNAFKKKKFLIAKTKVEAEEIYKNIKEIPWQGKQAPA